MQKKKKKFSCFFLFFYIISLFLSGCYYHLEGEQRESFTIKKIAVPYIQGDLDGRLTETLIKTLSQSTQLAYAKKNEEWIFEGKIGEDSLEDIGYQYDRDPLSDERINRLIPNEGNRMITLSFSLIDAKTDEIVLGPVDVSASQDFDFVDTDSLFDVSYMNPEGSLEPVLFFSLGQLDSKEGAKNSALTPLYKTLSCKIVEGIEHALFHLERSSLEEKN